MENNKKPNSLLTDIKHDILRKIFSKRFIRFRTLWIGVAIIPYGIISHVFTYPRVVEIR